jgi:hypothetical protein
VTELVIELIVVAVVIAAPSWCLARGLRNGDRPADATVTAVVRDAGQPDERRPVILAAIENPSATPVLAGLEARKARTPPRLSGSLNVTVPRRTARRKFRPSAYATVGIVPGKTTVSFTVPVRDSARRYLLTAAVGQSSGRLRLYHLHLAGATRAAPRAAATGTPGGG